MQSYKNRFNGQTPEILDYARIYGRMEALDKYAPKGNYLSFTAYLVDASGDPNIGLNPRVSGQSCADVADYIVASLFKTVEDLKRQLKEEREARKAERIARIEAENFIKGQGAKLIAVLEEE